MPVATATIEQGAIHRNSSPQTSLQQPYREQSIDDQRLAEGIAGRQKKLEDNRALVEMQWNIIDEFITGRRAVWDLGTRRGRLVGDGVGDKIYDQTTAAAGSDLADGLQSNKASPAMKWWAAHLRDATARKDYMTRKWIDEVEDISSTEMSQSDFYDQLNEHYQDKVFMGTATMAKPLWLPDDNQLHYETHHPREIFIARGPNGRVNLWHRKFPMTMRNIAEEFGIEKLDLKMRQAVEKNPYERRMVIHAIFLNKERDTSKWTSENKRIASVYILENEKQVLRKKGFDDWPLITSCWRLNSQEDYGRGPAQDAIYEAASMNSAVKYLMDSAQLALMKPMAAQESLKGKIKITPWGITWLAPGEAPPTELFHGKDNYPIGVDQIMKMRAEIRERFKSDTFKLIASLTAQTSRMNMMQIAELQGEKATLLGPISTRDDFESLSPLLNATFHVLRQNNRLPPPPLSVMQYAQTPVDIEFLGPISTAQKRYLQAQGVAPFLQRLIGDQPLLAVWPNLKDKVKEDELYDYLFEADGAPTKIDQDPTVYAQMQQARIKAQQEAQKQALAEKVAKGYPGLTKAPEPGSPAAGKGGGQ